MEHKHTPAPWEKQLERKASINGKRHTIIEVIAPNAGNKKDFDSLGIAVILLPEGEYTLKEKTEATNNARLIAAAPDLLAALDDLVAAHDGHQYFTFEHWEDAKAVINKAKGL